MSLSSTGTYLDYSLSFLCLPYATPFKVNLFLAPTIPPGLNYDLPITVPSYIGQEFVMPGSPTPIPQPYIAGGPEQDSAAKEATYDSQPVPGQDLAAQEATYDSQPGPELQHQPVRRTPSDEAEPPVDPPSPPLDLSLLPKAVRSSHPLNPSLVRALDLPGIQALCPEKRDAIRSYLAHNLRWTASGNDAGARGEIPLRDIPMRVWVVERELEPLPDGEWGSPIVRHTEIAFDVGEGKPGALGKGEIPEVEPKEEA
ncbi:MAG: hypothetical protein M1837_001915 [Sclerophora amabilis]|nr:MAG: hypothetical protein M1837_001915 [Sclerophora amabilis]